MGVDAGEKTDVCTMERRFFQGGSLITVLFCTVVSAISIGMVVYLVLRGDPDPLALVIYGAYPLMCVPIVLWEMAHCLPAKVELHPDSVKLFVNGRLRKEVVFDKGVKADVHLGADLLGPDPKAFSNCCDADIDGGKPGQFLILSGLRFSGYGTDISVSQDQGWSLKDIMTLWDPLVERVNEHDMAMGRSMWRYLEFRMGLGLDEGGISPDIFERFRAMEPGGS
jgi:hypothetical protein